MSGYDKKDIVDIIIKRDGVSLEEAQELVDITQDDVDDLVLRGSYDLDAIEEIIKDNLGLEPDYVMDFI